MRRYLIICFFIGIFSFANIWAVQKSEHLFYRDKYIHFLLPLIHEANARVLLQRKQLLAIHEWLLMRRPISAKQKVWVKQLAKAYRVKNFNIDNPKDWDILIKRVDVIPPSLALAQSIIESNWGRSRFATQANNLYGTWCYTKGCGLVPKQRPQGATFEVKAYSSPLDSVCHYVYSLDTGYAYKKFRNLRYQERCKQQILSGIELAKTMNLYSQQREVYVRSLENLISKYHLSRYDVKK